ncbi:MAG TPA: EAL domain-containing protein [Verrucomicrobiae bacterium]|nr:EAL domain-containing protein [Verrucomicrobiae bacterium]
MSDKFRRSLRAGETLFRQGEPGDCAYAIESGQLEVFRGRGKQRKVLALLGPGEVIGEMAVIDHGPRTASAVAKKPTRLRVITQDHLQGKLDSADPLVRVLLRLVLQRYRAAVAGKRGSGAKRVGNDRKAALARNRLSQELELALEKNQFVLHYQPIIRLEGVGVAGYEALVRWQHPTRGLLPPAGFIPMMEESDMIHRLGAWTLHAACEALRRLHSHPGSLAGAPLFMCVNLSGRELESPEILKHVDHALTAANIAPEQLRLEVTESALIASLDLAGQVLGKCRERGVQIAVDDFGTGYSSLNYLRHFPVDTLKIDRSFVTPVRIGEDSRQFLRTIRDLAHALRMTIVAEGIETIDQARMVHELGLEYAQGYLFRRPVPEAEAAALLSARWPWSFERRGVERRHDRRS